MSSPSILQCLHDTLSLKGFLHIVYSQIESNPARSWLLKFPVSFLPVGSKGVQFSVLAFLAGTEMCEDDLDSAIKDKLKITLGSDLFRIIHFQEDCASQNPSDFCWH